MSAFAFASSFNKRFPESSFLNIVFLVDWFDFDICETV